MNTTAVKPQVLHPLIQLDGYVEQVCRIPKSPQLSSVRNSRLILFFSLVVFFYVLMNLSACMAHVTPTRDQVWNPTSPSQYWQSRLGVWTPFADINNAMPGESTRLNSYSYEIALLKHAAVLVPLGGISIRLADARVRLLISVKTHNSEPFTSTFEKWMFIISLQMCLWISQKGLPTSPNHFHIQCCQADKEQPLLFSTVDGSVRLKGWHPASQGNVKISHSPIALLINTTH